ncbi:MAG: response regulator [Clostridiaceae bacterium]
MIKIMITEDRPQFREYLKTCIDWESYGFTICCEAKNGEEALEKAKIYYPDIVLSDISMPKMDGLELAEKLYNKYPDISVVLITGYSKFEYARKALQIGVSDYILKPFEKEELILTLLKLQDNINKSYEAKILEESNQIILRNDLFNNIFYNENNDSFNEIENKFLSYGVKFDSKLFMILCCDIDKTQEKSEKIEENLLWKNTVSNLLAQIVENNVNHYTLTDYEGRIISILEFENNSLAENFNLEDYEKFNELINNNLNISITIGVGGLHSGFIGLRKSYLESIDALNSMYYLGKNKIIKYRDIPEQNRNYGFYSIEKNEKLLKYLRENNNDATTNTLNEIFLYIKDNNLSTEYTKIINVGLISLLLSYIVQSGRNIIDVLGKNFLPYEEFENLSTRKEQENWIANLYEKAMDYYKNNKNGRSSKIAKEAIKYINNNFNDNSITVSNVAKSQYINETYLRSMFKKEIGMTVSEYINKIRMEKSKELLSENIYKLAEISYMVGFNDPGYFSKSFKKHFGISPSKFH